MKQIEVVAAIIHDNAGRIFATQRGYGDYKAAGKRGQSDACISYAEREQARLEGKAGWEFPGGKMEAGETPEEALMREIWEELETRIVVERLVQTVEYDYPKFHLKMHCFWCHVESGSLTLKEHEAAKWLAKDELGSVKWLPADVKVVEVLMSKTI